MLNNDIGTVSNLKIIILLEVHKEKECTQIQTKVKQGSG